jgi:uncharacterized membrane protein YhiD involved in acid resistance
MLNGFQNNLFTSIAIEQFIANIIMALICGLVISLIYRWTYRGPHYSATYIHSIVILSMVTALVIMVIGNNLARAFGLVGAMSIIRFRTAVKDTQDIVFIFYSLAAGMASGVGLKFIAFTGTVIIGVVIFILHRFNYARPIKHDFLLQFIGKLINGDSPYTQILQKYCKSNVLVNTQSLGENQFEFSYHIRLKKENQRFDLINELKANSDVTNVRLFFDEEQ